MYVQVLLIIYGHVLLGHSCSTFTTSYLPFLPTCTAMSHTGFFHAHESIQALYLLTIVVITTSKLVLKKMADLPALIQILEGGEGGKGLYYPNFSFFPTLSYGLGLDFFPSNNVHKRYINSLKMYIHTDT